MSQIEIVPFRASHLLEFEPRLEGAYAPGDPMRLWKLALEYEREGPALTMRVEGKAIACAGVVIGPEGVGTAWLLASEEVGRYRIALYRTVKTTLDQIVRHFHLRRVQTMVPDGFQHSWAWFERLGFVHEATLKKAGPAGEDRHIFVRMA
jgi:hypothetical protein